MKPATKRICLSLLSSLTLTAGYHVTAQTKPSVARDLDAIPLSLDARAEASLSITRGILKVEGLRDPVDVLRDRWGVAHIYACNQHDLFFAQGYVAAQDRLFQMELWKRAGQGRLAEIWGPGALQRDVNARLLSYRGDMKSEIESHSPGT
jgi:penicillin G amidase